jgi:predicted  nucleic acid-binding Zn-ribbon protein
MAEKSPERDASRSVFGLNEPDIRRTTTPEPSAPSPSPAPPQGAPQYVYVQGPPPGAVPAAPSSGVKVIPILVALLLIVAGINLYLTITGQKQINDTASKQADELNSLTRRMNTSDQRYADLSARFQVTSEKLGLTQQELGRAKALTASIEKQQQAAVQQLNQAIAQKASAEELNKVEADENAKIGGLSTDIAGTKKDLANARDEFTGALAGTKGELTGAIARTHDELVALAHRTDRDYFEFNVRGKKGGQKVGGVTVQLVKANAKRNTYTVNLQFDDASHPTREHTTNEPVYFYTQGASSALELVVNKIGKDSIVGYLSTPKGLFPGTANVLGTRPGA